MGNVTQVANPAPLRCPDCGAPMQAPLVGYHQCGACGVVWHEEPPPAAIRSQWRDVMVVFEIAVVLFAAVLVYVVFVSP